ncbi:hypothetical protein HPB51_029196 [Rhipicephalus microplus]|uniref:Band 7 domain-containing protein n=1 Tax=Rhipicephalus microplus TaxID=6941 RepID=A0A9J6CVJ6_RHIMP|nr:hypothetical protein HPB51_029196 [Rhipicephalus microplus]
MVGFVACGPNEALVVSVGEVGECTHLKTINLSSVVVRYFDFLVKQVKIQGQNVEMLRAACEQFLGKKDEEVMHIARETLEGHQRAIMGTMSVEEIYKDRKKFSKQVFEVASSDLVNMGITVVSYTIKDISDDEGYLRALGMARTAEVKRDARIGEAEAQRDSQIKVLPPRFVKPGFILFKATTHEEISCTVA